MDAVNEDELIGVTGNRAARLAGISLHRLAAWEHNGLLRPQVRTKKSAKTVRIYNLDELVELRVASQLEAAGITVAEIRRVVEAYRVSVEHPLRELRWGVDGKKIYACFDDGQWVGGHQPMQSVMLATINIEEIRASLRSEALTRPDELAGKVEKRPGTMGNKPVFAGTRTPVSAVQSYLRRGYRDDRILEAFPHLTRADIQFARDELSAQAV